MTKYCAQNHKNISNIISAEKGKGRKRSRNESFLSVCALIQQKQEVADESVLKMIEAELQKEIEMEEKPRMEAARGINDADDGTHAHINDISIWQ